MVKRYRLFPAVIPSYEYQSPSCDFLTGYLLTKSGSVKFFTTTLSLIECSKAHIFLTEVSDIPGYQTDVLLAFETDLELDIRNQLKSLLPLLEDVDKHAVIKIVQLVLNRNYVGIRECLPSEIYTEWVFEAKINEFTLEEYMVKHHFDNFFNDWVASPKKLAAIQRKIGNSNAVRPPLHGLHIGSEAFEQVSKIVRPAEPIDDIDSADLKYPYEVLNNVIEIADQAFAHSGILYVPGENKAQRLFIAIASGLGYQIYDIYVTESVYDIQTPCLITGKTRSRPALTHMLQNISGSLRLDTLNPLAIAFKRNFGDTSSSLLDVYSKFTVAPDKIDQYVKKLIEVFNKKETGLKTALLDDHSTTYCYRGIIVGAQPDVERLMHFATGRCIWIEPES